MHFHSNNMAVISVLVKRAANDACMNHLLLTLFCYAAIYKFHFSAEHIPGICITAADALSRNDITSFLVSFLRWCLWRFRLWYWIWWWRLTQIGACHTGSSCLGALCSGPLPSHSQCLLFRYKAVCCLLPASVSPTSPLHRSPLPYSDLTLCRFVSSLYTQRLSHSSIHSYLSSLRFLQILAGGPDPSLGVFSQLHYVVRVVGPLSPRSNRPAQLPVTSDILAHLWAVWSAAPFSYTNCMLCAACCLGFAAFLHSGEFTCPSLEHTTRQCSPGVMCWLIVIPAQPSWLFDSVIARRMFLALGSP